MQDGIIKGTGNSRYLKGAGWPATYEEFKSMAEAGTLPIDLAGINAAGWQQIGTALAKANLLTDTVAALINTLTGTTPETPNDALSLLTEKSQALYDGRVQIATGSYTGTGAYGSSNPTVINTGLTDARILIVYNTYNGNAIGVFVAGAKRAPVFRLQSIDSTTQVFYGCQLSVSNGIFSFYNTASAFNQLNDALGDNGTYGWISIGG